MNLTIETLSHPQLHFYKELPPGYSNARLPGGEIMSAHGSFGRICFQEFDGGSFLLRYSVLKLKEPLVLTTRSNFTGVHSTIIMQSGIIPVIQGIGEMKIREGQFIILQADRPKATIEFNTKRQYSIFEAMISESLAKEVLEGFSEFDIQLLERSPVIPNLWVDPPDWTPAETDELVRNILTYPEGPQFRQTYFYNKVRDIYFDLLVRMNSNTDFSAPITDEEMSKVFATEAAILADLSRHDTIRELAKKAMTSESRLKTIFKLLIGMGIHEYRIDQRLQRAVRLLHEGMYIKEVAAVTGWSVGRLIVAYKKRYGITPGVIRKKGR